MVKIIVTPMRILHRTWSLVPKNFFKDIKDILFFLIFIAICDYFFLLASRSSYALIIFWTKPCLTTSFFEKKINFIPSIP